MSIPPRELLAHVLREGRFLTGESPERVAEVLDLAGRTIRRLEAGAIGRPRAVTLEVLGAYYALDPAFLKWLARLEPDANSSEALQAWADEVGVETRETNPRRLALLLARAGTPQRRIDGDVKQMMAELGALDPSRRLLVHQLLRQLRMSQSEERRRQELGQAAG